MKNTGRFKKKLKTSIVSIVVAIAVSPLFVLGMAHAASDAYFSLSPSSGSYTTGKAFTVQVYETSSSADNTNAVQANLLYSSQLLKLDSVSINGPFTLVGQNSSGSGSVKLGIASSTTVSGTQKVAALTFTVDSTGTAGVKMTTGSDIDSTSGTSVWNGSLPGASYNLASPPTTSTGSTSGSSTTSSGGGSTSASTASTPKAPAKTPTKPTNKPKTTPPSPSSAAQLGSISIRVLNSQGKPVSGARVTLNNYQTVTSNNSGVANFSGIASGTYSITISGPGITTTTSTISLQAGENKLVSLHVKESSNASPLILLIVILVALAAVVLAGLIWKFKWNWKFWRRRNKVQNGPATPINQNVPPTPIINPSADTLPATSPNQTLDGAPQPQQQVIAPTNSESEPKIKE